MGASGAQVRCSFTTESRHLKNSQCYTAKSDWVRKVRRKEFLIYYMGACRKSKPESKAIFWSGLSPPFSYRNTLYVNHYSLWGSELRFLNKVSDEEITVPRRAVLNFKPNQQNYLPPNASNPTHSGVARAANPQTTLELTTPRETPDWYATREMPQVICNNGFQPKQMPGCCIDKEIFRSLPMCPI